MPKIGYKKILSRRGTDGRIQDNDGGRVGVMWMDLFGFFGRPKPRDSKVVNDKRRRDFGKMNDGV
jgi:hypothetical protein